MYPAFGTALSLARFDAQKEGKKKIRVKKSHVIRVVKMSRHFTEYLASVNKGKTPEQIAKKQGIRDDDFGEAAKPTKLEQINARNEGATKKKSKKVEEEEEEDGDEEEDEDEDEDEDEEDDEND